MVGSKVTGSKCETTKSESGIGVESGIEWAGVVKEKQLEVQEESEVT